MPTVVVPFRDLPVWLPEGIKSAGTHWRGEFILLSRTSETRLFSGGDRYRKWEFAPPHKSSTA